jgi:hypothetical protein
MRVCCTATTHGAPPIDAGAPRAPAKPVEREPFRHTPPPALTPPPLPPPPPPPRSPLSSTTQATHVLFESASGYALFDVRALDEIATSADKVQESIR